MIQGQVVPASGQCRRLISPSGSGAIAVELEDVFDPSVELAGALGVVARQLQKQEFPGLEGLVLLDGEHPVPRMHASNCVAPTFNRRVDMSTLPRWAPPRPL
jgi:hypothetical protein